MLAICALSVLLAAPLQLPRVDQPTRVDSSVHGGVPRLTGAGDLTADGRVAVLARAYIDPATGQPANALVAVTADPDFVQSTVYGYLDKLLDEVPNVPQTFGGLQIPLYGDNYTFSPMNESYLIEQRPDSSYPGPTPPTTPGGNLPNVNGFSPLAITLKALDPNGPSYGENPYPCDASGNYQLDGTHEHYELWMVDCNYPWHWNATLGEWYVDQANDPVRLGGRDLSIIVDESLPRPRVVSATAGTFHELTIGSTGTSVKGHEPTITADGRLILYHADGGNNLGQLPGNPWGRTTYIYNANPYQSSGWSAPRSVCDMYWVEADVGGPNYAPTVVGTIQGQQVLFRDMYALARNPIREPDGGTFAFGDKIIGPYPWVEKDGSFYAAMYTFTDEADPTGANPNAKATRAGYYVTGNITQGYMKHVDDTALNPTRAGGFMEWPITGMTGFTFVTNSNRLITTSTGLKPSLWQPFRGEGVPVPSQDASTRIPVLPVFSLNLDMYGEVRFEEADGNYVLYIAGNEGYRQHPTVAGVMAPDPYSTPDTSGRVPRATCVLENGAAFPQEVYGSNQAVRDGIGQAMGLTTPAHECVGFKGQALLFPTKGRVSVTGTDTYSDELTVQAFVKVLSGWSGPLTLIEDPGRFELSIDAARHFVGQVWANFPGIGVFAVPVTSQTTVGVGEPDAFDPTAGWHHVALVFDGDLVPGTGGTLALIYIDGQFEDFAYVAGYTSTVDDPPGPSTIYVGPNDPAGSDDPADAVLVLDEIAVSDVMRTEAELRRDAYVAPPDDGFGPWPPDVGLPLGLNAAQAKWPVGVTYTVDKRLLGRDLFQSVILSGTGTAAPAWGNVSCATCHEPGNDFAEAQQLASKFGGGFLALNTPTVLNSAFGAHKFFDGRVPSLEAQVPVPIAHPDEMNLPISEALGRLNDPANLSPNGVSWLTRFQNSYGASATQENLEEVLALYLRTLNSGGSRFDLDLLLREGSPDGADALSAAEKRGRALFFGRARCFACHDGSAFSDDDFHNVQSVDALGTFVGRGGFTGRAQELGMVKVPTLRNISATGPYFHDGQAATLTDVVSHYERGGGRADGHPALGEADRQLLPLFLSSGEKADLVAFLQALLGTHPH